MESTWIEASSAIGMPAHDRSGSHVTLGRNVSPRRNGLLDRILRKVLAAGPRSYLYGTTHAYCAGRGFAPRLGHQKSHISLSIFARYIGWRSMASHRDPVASKYAPGTRTSTRRSLE
jgi:hypothetical protein